VLERLVARGVTSLVSRTATLEEIFLRHYAGLRDLIRLALAARPRLPRSWLGFLAVAVVHHRSSYKSLYEHPAVARGGRARLGDTPATLALYGRYLLGFRRRPRRLAPARHRSRWSG
jgi:hypothetical protein